MKLGGDNMQFIFNGTLDELAGEFDLEFKPLTAKFIDKMIDLKEALQKKRRK